jgi:signal transduction histidine kinase
VETIHGLSEVAREIPLSPAVWCWPRPPPSGTLVRSRTTKRPPAGDDADGVWILTFPEGEERTARAPRAATPRGGTRPRPMSADLLATLAHELRTPLATLRVTLETIADLPASNSDDAVRLMPQLRRGVGWLERLVDNLTTTALMHSGHLPLRCVPVAMDDCLDAALGVLQPLLEQRAQRVMKTCSEPAPWVRADPVWLGQVLLNLLSNASAYSPPESEIGVTISSQRGWVEVRVQDQGPGIPRCEQAHIFSPYVRGRAGRQARANGLGLGLHIVQTLVRLHSGTVGVRSAAGKGACFWFRLPCLGLVPAPRHMAHGTGSRS